VSAAQLEIAANSLASALAAQAGGADRIELCAALEIGGLTPSHAMIALVRARVKIPIYVLIRTRAGDFVYDDAECETMQRDIEHCVAEGCDGVVLGALDAHGNVDVPRCRALIAAAGKLGVTFHRAIDVARDARIALQDIIALGCERVLTSGAKPNALAGAALIGDLVAQAAGRVAIMAGGGVDAATITALRAQTGAKEFHASAKRMLVSRARHATPASAGMDAGEWRTDASEVRRLVAALRG